VADHIGDGPGDDIGPDGIVVPDVPQTALAFRTWRLSEGNKLLSINAPNLTGKAGGSGQNVRKIGWIHRHLADEEGQNGWPIATPLVAHCGVRGAGAEAIPEHGKIPGQDCTCGIYATTELKVINSYLGNEVYLGVAIRGPVLGIVEMGGRVIPATQGFRARYARVAAILAIDEVFSLSHAHLEQIAELYQVPLLKPHSINPEDYREAIGQMPAVSDDKIGSVGDEADQFLASLFSDDENKDKEEDKDEDDKEGGDE
jgi:hypothetical protein